jgi:mono/diheme cytochrome c family protein
MQMKQLVFGFAVAASAWAPQAFAGSPGHNNFGPFPSLGPLGDGRRVFLEYNCSGCHGNAAQGGGMGANISGGLTVDAIYNAVMRGEPYGGMPSFANYLDMNDVNNLYAYLNNFGNANQPQWVAWWQDHPKF